MLLAERAVREDGTDRLERPDRPDGHTKRAGWRSQTRRAGRRKAPPDGRQLAKRPFQKTWPAWTKPFRGLAASDRKLSEAERQC